MFQHDLKHKSTQEWIQYKPSSVLDHVNNSPYLPHSDLCVCNVISFYALYGARKSLIETQNVVIFCKNN